MDDLTALFHPAFNDQTIFEILDNSSLLEGDIIRFFRQIMDRLRQVKIASQDRDLQDKLSLAQHKLETCLAGIDAMKGD